jgi:hypothetical protein
LEDTLSASQLQAEKSLIDDFHHFKTTTENNLEEKQVQIDEKYQRHLKEARLGF